MQTLLLFPDAQEISRQLHDSLPETLSALSAGLGTFVTTRAELIHKIADQFAKQRKLLNEIPPGISAALSSLRPSSPDPDSQVCTQSIATTLVLFVRDCAIPDPISSLERPMRGLSFEPKN